jgi:sodium-dependent dicarboxylate transporter 2/3/5
VAYGASAGGIATLIGTPPNIVLAGQTRELLPHVAEIGFGRWMLVGVPVSVALLGLAAAAILILGPAAPLAAGGGRGRDYLRGELQALGPLGAGERGVLAVFVVTVALWLTRQDLPLGAWTLPGWSRLFPEPGFLHDATVAVAAGLVLLALRVPGADGPTPLLDWPTVRRRTPWGILLLFGGGFALAAGMQESGLAAWIGGRLGGLRGLPLPLVVLAVCLLTTFLTEVTSNTATSTLLLPILAAAAPALAVPPLLLMVPAALSASCAFMLPVATPPNAIVFGSGWLTVPRMARVGVVLNLVGAVAVALLSWWLVPRALGPS